jgi:hypothetical protein
MSAGSLLFGAGNFYGTNPAANSTPHKVVTMQEISFDMSYTTKQLMGQYSAPIDVRRGAMKFGGKAKFANVNGAMLNDLFFNQTTTTGQLLSAVAEVGTIPATPFTITVVNGATWTTDLGVVYSATGLALTKVASAPIAGQYSVGAGGVYTFAAADTTLGVYIDYLYTSATGGTLITLSNQLMGTQPFFKGVFTSNVSGKIITLVLNQCTSSKLSFSTKTEDYGIPEMDIEIMADSGNNIGQMSIAA